MDETVLRFEKIEADVRVYFRSKEYLVRVYTLLYRCWLEIGKKLDNHRWILISYSYNFTIYEDVIDLSRLERLKSNEGIQRVTCNVYKKDRKLISRNQLDDELSNARLT